MKRLFGGMAVVALAMGIATEAVSAQLDGNPVYAVNPGVGVTLNADYGRGLNDESGETNYYGARVVLGVSAVSFWGGVGQVDMRNPDPTVDDTEVSWGGGAAINLIKAPLVPVSLTLQLGAASVGCGDDCNDIRFVAGPALRINIPTQIIGIEPWVMPRYHMERNSSGDESVMQHAFGVSGGLNIRLPMGLGFHIVVDYADLPDAIEGTFAIPESSPVTGGIGLHYKIAVPSLGLPLVPVLN